MIIFLSFFSNVIFFSLKTLTSMIKRFHNLSNNPFPKPTSKPPKAPETFQKLISKPSQEPQVGPKKPSYENTQKTPFRNPIAKSPKNHFLKPPKNPLLKPPQTPIPKLSLQKPPLQNPPPQAPQPFKFVPSACRGRGVRGHATAGTLTHPTPRPASVVTAATNATPEHAATSVKNALSIILL